MILAIDAGNTDITFGTIEDGAIGTVARIHTERDYTPEEYGIKIKSLLDYYGVDPHSFEGAILSSVVPPVTNVLRLAVNRLTGLDCLVVGPGIRTGMNVRIDDPTTLAADLAVGSVAAIACYGAPGAHGPAGTFQRHQPPAGRCPHGAGKGHRHQHCRRDAFRCRVCNRFDDRRHDRPHGRRTRLCVHRGGDRAERAGNPGALQAQHPVR